MIHFPRLFPGMRAIHFVTMACIGLAAPGAYAYIDPNAGGWLYQAALPVLLALAGAWAILRQKIGDAFGKLVAWIRGWKR